MTSSDIAWLSVDLGERGHDLRQCIDGTELGECPRTRDSQQGIVLLEPLDQPRPRLINMHRAKRIGSAYTCQRIAGVEVAMRHSNEAGLSEQLRCSRRCLALHARNQRDEVAAEHPLLETAVWAGRGVIPSAGNVRGEMATHLMLVSGRPRPPNCCRKPNKDRQHDGHTDGAGRAPENDQQQAHELRVSPTSVMILRPGNDKDEPLTPNCQDRTRGG